MELALHNSSGTVDEIQPSHFEPTPASYPRMQFDMESQIHQLEQEAYRSVLRAFKAQSDAISWEQEGLITEVRKELRVSDDEHRELLSTINTDDIICTIREWRKAGESKTGMLNVSQPMHGLLPSPTVSASWKKQKTSQSGFLAFSIPKRGSHNQPAQSLPASSKWAPFFAAGGQKSRPGPQVAGQFAHYAYKGPTPRGVSNGNGAPSRFSMNTNAEVARRDPLIGQKVMILWHENDNFYEAVIADYNPQQDRHALVYNRNTPKEAWAWVDLEEIPHDDILWVAEEEFPLSENVVVKASDEIEILHTDTLIKEIQRLFTTTHPTPPEIEKAKEMLKEHERALMDVISKLGDAANGGSGAEQRSPHDQSMDVEQRWRNSLNGVKNHVPGSEAETSRARANGSVVANGTLNQQEDDMIEI